MFLLRTREQRSKLGTAVKPTDYQSRHEYCYDCKNVYGFRDFPLFSSRDRIAAEILDFNTIPPIVCTLNTFRYITVRIDTLHSEGSWYPVNDADNY